MTGLPVALERLFDVMDSLPTLTTQDAADPGQAMTRRTGELHTCAFCDARAKLAYVLGPAPMLGIDTLRWLDLCAPCAWGDGKVIGMLRSTDDDEIFARYMRWREQDAEPTDGSKID